MAQRGDGRRKGRPGDRSAGRGLASALAIGVALFGAMASAQPVAQVGQGRLAGRSEPEGVTAYLGVPFAAPPVGDRRWRPPAPAIPWQGVRAADQFAASCPQPTTPNGFGPWTPEYIAPPPMAEDCLYLNVWSPPAGAARRPVLVWIHGGGFTGGSGSVPIYDGARLAAKGVVVVTINYRLGALGFLAHPELTAESGASGNYGLMDQIAALQWVRRNIAALGGDPDQVTIAGQSAGAISVLDLMRAPDAQGLFKRAIAESGAGLDLPQPPLAVAEAQGRAFAEARGAKSIADLRALPLAQLMAAPTAGGAGPPALQFAPIRDGKVLKLAGESLPETPLMTGMTADEASGFDPLHAHATLATFQHQARARYGASADEALGLYPATSDAQAQQAALDLERGRGLAATLFWLDQRAGAVRAPAFAYLYDHPEPGPDADRYGAFHSSEIPYVFLTLDKAQRPFTEHDHALAEMMSSYWLNFIRTGDPNGASLPAWPQFAAGQGQVMRLGDQTGVQRLDPAKYRFFDAFRRAGGSVSLF